MILCGCDKEKIASDFADKSPIFAPEVFFKGHTEAWGMNETLSGVPKESFHYEADGYKDSDDSLTLSQHFTFAGGSITDRQWSFTKIDEHHYEGTAEDVHGTAHGEAYGNVFHWTYTVERARTNPLKNVTMEHWMYLQQDGTVLDRVSVRKWGLPVAQMTEYLRHMSDEPATPEY